MSPGLTESWGRINVISYFRFLRPHVQKQRELSPSLRIAYLHFYSASKSLCNLATHKTASATKVQEVHTEEADKFDNKSVRLEHTASTTSRQPPGHPSRRRKGREDVEQRVNELRTSNALEYPRIRPDRRALTCSEFRSRYSVLKPEQSKLDDVVTLRGALVVTSRQLQY